jgi:hypothetical protein
MTYLHSHYPALAYNTRPSHRRTTSGTVRELLDEQQQPGQEGNSSHEADTEDRSIAGEQTTNPTPATPSQSADL